MDKATTSSGLLSSLPPQYVTIGTYVLLAVFALMLIGLLCRILLLVLKAAFVIVLAILLLHFSGQVELTQALSKLEERTSYLSSYASLLQSFSLGMSGEMARMKNQLSPPNHKSFDFKGIFNSARTEAPPTD